jgi:AbrB family looped-hinge helix DNA binding protein
MQTTLSSKGQVILPAELRERDAIAPGARFEVKRLRAGQYLLKRVPTAGPGGLVEWLLACPEKGWFQPIESESTADL